MVNKLWSAAECEGGYQGTELGERVSEPIGCQMIM